VVVKTRHQQRGQRGRAPDKGLDKSTVSAVAPPSLPLADAGSVPLPPLVVCPKCGTKYLKKRNTCNTCGEWHPEKLALPASLRLKDDSPVRLKALKIAAMELAGIDRDQIATVLGMARCTVTDYLYKAGRNGWLDHDDPRKALEYQLLPQAVRELHEGMKSNAILATGMKERTAVALKVADGALYPRVDTAAVSPSTSIVGIKIEVLGGTPQMREGTMAGGSQYLEAESVPTREPQ